MKSKPERENPPAKRPVGSTSVCLLHHAPEAKSVCVAGTFNDWKPDATPSQRRDDGTWSVELDLAPAVYEYRFLVDGAWCADPAASETTPNPFGESNTVLRIMSPE